MQRIWTHIQYHAMQYLIPLMLLLVLSVGGVGVAVSGIPVDKIRWEALKTLIIVAKAMTKTDPLQQSNELVKLEGRRRTAGWKDTSEVLPWNHRFLEEGTDLSNHWVKYKVKAPRHPRPTTRGRALKDLYVKMEIGLAITVIVVGLFMYYVGTSWMGHLNTEIYNYFKLIGRI